MCKHASGPDILKTPAGLHWLNHHHILSLHILFIYRITQPSNILYAIHLPNQFVSHQIPLAAGMLGSSRVRSNWVFVFTHNETNRKSSTDAGKQTSGWTQEIHKPQHSQNCELIIWTPTSHQVFPKGWPYICIIYMTAHHCSEGIVMNHQAPAVFKATSSKVLIWRVLTFHHHADFGDSMVWSLVYDTEILYMHLFMTVLTCKPSAN